MSMLSPWYLEGQCLVQGEARMPAPLLEEADPALAITTNLQSEKGGSSWLFNKVGTIYYKNKSLPIIRVHFSLRY